jgi:acetone carboxylase gamma subunit
VVAIAYYNLGVQNLQVTGKHWNKKGGAAQLIAKDIEAIFSAKHGIEVVLLSEFGNMYDSIDKSWRQSSVGPHHAASNSTVSFFEALLKDLKLDDIAVHALAPYVALVNSEVWKVEKCEALFRLCSKPENFAMHLLMKHKVSGVVVRAMNCHIPTKFATKERKRETVTKLCTVCTDVDYTNMAHPTPCWVIGGDLNVDEGTLKHWCQVFVKPHVPCVSTSAGNMSLARKSDIAISQGIDLDAIPSWVGYDMDSHASDAHNMVAVMGVIKSSGSSHSAAKAQAKAASSSSAGSYLAAARIGSASGEKPVSVAEIEAASSSSDGLHLAAAVAVSKPVSFASAESTVSFAEAPARSTETAITMSTTAAPAAAAPGAARAATAAAAAAATTLLAAAAAAAAATAAAPAPAPAPAPTPPPPTTVSDCSRLADTRAGSTSAQTEQQDEADWGVADDFLETLSGHADNEDSAAQELLNIIFSCKDSRAIKSKQEVLDLVAEPVRRREAYIHKLAVIRGVPQPAAGQYTMQQWKWWLSSRPPDKEDMEGAVDE